jgi:hypothetical protein
MARDSHFFSSCPVFGLEGGRDWGYPHSGNMPQKTGWRSPSKSAGWAQPVLVGVHTLTAEAFSSWVIRSPPCPFPFSSSFLSLWPLRRAAASRWVVGQEMGVDRWWRMGAASDDEQRRRRPDLAMATVAATPSVVSMQVATNQERRDRPAAGWANCGDTRSDARDGLGWTAARGSARRHR